MIHIKYPGPLTALPSLYHDAVGGGLPPVLLHRQLKSSPSFTVFLVGQLMTAVGCTIKKSD